MKGFHDTMFINILIGLLSMIPANEKKGKLIIEVSGVKEVRGDIQIGIYNKADGFTEKNTVYMGKVVSVNGSTVIVEVPDLPHGTYAISAYHDKNSNGLLDKGLFGVPTEVYGFSNNARGTFGPPSFDDAKFLFNSSVSKVSLQLK